MTSNSPEMRTYFVAVDHVSRSVIVSIRGTYSFSDTMVDLLCNPVGEYGGLGWAGLGWPWLAKANGRMDVWYMVDDG